jgi:predicted phage-related endonuclease
MEWGNRLEDVIIDKFADEHPEYVLLRDVGSWAHNERPWQKANPDFLYIDETGELCLGEVKTAQYEDDWKTITRGEYAVPLHYETQVQWYMQTLGIKKGALIVLFHGNLYKEITFEAHRFEQEIYLEDCQRFWEHVQKDTKPDWDGSDITVETVRKQHPEIDADSSVELMELAKEYSIADEQVKQYTDTLNKTKAQILDLMGNAKYGTYGGEIAFVRSARGQGVPYLTVKKGAI